MGYQNENKRVSSQANEFDKVEIYKNGKFFMGGDATSVCIVWNNLIGANLENEEHRNYLLRNNISNGTYTINGNEKTTIEKVILEIDYTSTSF
jgi:hypothetical protein